MSEEEQTFRYDKIEEAIEILEDAGLEMSYDPKAKAVYIYFRPRKSLWSHRGRWTKEFHPNILADFDNEGNILGVELLLPTKSE